MTVTRLLRLQRAVLVLLIFLPFLSSATVFTATASGNWTSSATWAAGLAPGITLTGADQIVVEAGVTVTLDTNVVIDNPLILVTLLGNIDDTGHHLTITSGSIAGVGELSASQITVGSLGSIVTTGAISTDILETSSVSMVLVATVHIKQQLKISAGTFNLANAGLLLLDADVTVELAGGSFLPQPALIQTAGPINIVYSGPSQSSGSELSISAINDVSVNLSGSDQTLTLNADLNVGDTLHLIAGTLLADDDLIAVHGTLLTETNAGISGNAGTDLWLQGNGNASVSFAPTGALLHSLVLNQTGGNLALHSSLSVDSISLEKGSLLLNDHNLSVTGSFSSVSGATLTGSANAGLFLLGGVNASLGFSPNGAVLDSLVINQSAGNVTLQSYLTVENLLDLEKGSLVLNGNDLVVNGALETAAGGSFTGNIASGLLLNGSGDLSLVFAPGGALLGTLIASQSGGNVILTSDLTVKTDVTLEEGALVLNGHNLTVNGIIHTTAGASITGSATSGLVLDGLGDMSLIFTANTAVLDTFLVSQSVSRITLEADLLVEKSLSLQQGSLALNGHNLTIHGSLTSTGGASIVGSSTSGVFLDGQGPASLNISTNGPLLDTLVVNQTGGNVTLLSDFSIRNLLSLKKGSLVLNGHELTINGNLANTLGATFTGSAASGLILDGAGNVLLFFAPNAAILQKLVVSQTSGNVTLTSDLRIATSLDLQQGSLVLNSNDLTLEGSLTNAPGATITGSATSGLILNGAGNVNLTFAANGAILDSLTVSQSGGNVTLRSNLTVAKLVDLQDGSLFLDVNNLTILGALITAPGAFLNGGVDAGLILNGTSDISLAFTPNGAKLDSLVISQITGNVILNTDLTVLKMVNLQQGSLDLHGNDLTINGGMSTLAGASLIGSLTSGLFLNGTSEVQLHFASGGAQLGTLLVSQSNGNVVLTGDLTVGTNLNLEQGKLVLNGNELTLTGTLATTPGSSITGTPTSGLILNGPGTADVTFSSNGYILGSLVVSQNGGNVVLHSDLIVTTSTTLDEGSLVLNGFDFTSNGILTTSPSASFTGSPTSGLFLNGFGAVSVVFATNGATLDTFLVSQSNGNVTLTSDLTVATLVNLEQGSLLLNGFNLRVNGTVSTTAGASFTGTSTSGLLLDGSGDISLVFAPNGAVLGNLAVGQAGGNVMLNSDLLVQTSVDLQEGSLLLNGYDLTIKGALSTAAGASLSGSATSGLILDGAGDVSLIFAANGAQLDTLVVSQSTGDVTLNGDLQIEGNLNLQSGNLVLGNHSVTLTNAAHISGGTVDSYVVTDGTGTLNLLVPTGNSGIFFPCGTSDGFFPAVLAQGAAGASTHLEVRVDAGVLAQGTTGTDLVLTESLVDNTWFIEASNSSAALDLNFTFYWSVDAEVNGFDHDKCFISHFDNGAWDIQPAAAATAETNGFFSISRTGIATLSPFSVANAPTINTTDLDLSDVQLFPNPADVNTPVLLQVESAKAMTVQLRVYDATGRVFSTESYDVRVGENRMVLPLAGLPGGVYFVDLQGVGEKGRVVRRVVRM